MLLDSTILIDLLNGKPRAIEKIAKIEATGEKLFTTQVNVFEIIQGIYGYGESIDDELTALETLLRKMKILDLTHFSAYEAGKNSGKLRKAGTTIQTGDALIAGIGLAHRQTTIVTDDKKSFSKIPGIQVEPY